MHTIKNILLRGAENRPMALDLFYHDAGPAPVVIYAHGFNGFKDWGNFDLIAGQFAIENHHLSYTGPAPVY